MGSALSNAVQIQVSPIIAPPVLAAAFNDIGSAVLLSWTEATAGITSFLVYRDSNYNGFELLVTLDGAVFDYIDQVPQDPIDDLNSAAYYVVATIGAAQSGPSNEVNNYAGV